MSSTKGVIFLGTPHRGSSKAALASMISSIIKIGLQRPNDKLLDTLAEASQILEEQVSNFSSIRNELQLVCFAEELPTGVGMIVPHSSATLPSFNARSGSIQENHMNMCKFSSRNDIGYKLRTWLRRLRRKLSKSKSEAPEKMKQMVLKITEQARGVFMWVKLVVEKILEAVEDESFVEELPDFIEGIPDELDDLFSRMLDDIKPAYRNHSATLFQLVLTSESWRPLTAVTLYFAEQATTEYVLSTTSLSPSNQHLDRISADRISANMQKRLRSHSAGLIELSRTAQGIDHGPRPMSPADPGFHVQFIHQTVNDLIDRKGGLSKIFGPTCDDMYHDSSMRGLRSSILGLSTLHMYISVDDHSHGLWEKQSHDWRFVHDAIHWARILDSGTGQDADEFATLLQFLDAAGKLALDPQVTFLDEKQ